MSYADWATSPAPAMPVMVNNRRREFRRMVLRDGVLAPYGNATTDTYRVVVVDIAGAGVGMRCREPLPDGAIFSLTIPSQPQYDHARVRVVRSRPCKGAQYEVGAEFC